MGEPQVVIEIVQRQKGPRIGLMSPWFPGVADMCKSVPGHSWDAKRKFWTYPLTLQTCRNLRRAFTDMLVIGSELRQWAADEVRREEEMEALGSAKDAELRFIPEIAPRLAAAMDNRPFQKVGARFIAEGREVLIADEPTLGKTIQCFGGLMEAGVWHGWHLVAAPKSSLETVWHDEVYKWTDDGQAFFMPDGKAARVKVIDDFMASDAPAKFLIINPEMLQIKLQERCKKCDIWIDRDTDMPMDHYLERHNTSKEIRKCDWPILFEQEWNSIIVDEAHKYLLGIAGANRKTQVGEGFTRLRVIENGCRIGSTGTPMKGKAVNFWKVFHWLRPKEYPSLWQFAESFLEITDNGFGKSIGDIRETREQDLYKSISGIMLRRTKLEVQPDLPENSYQDHWVSMLPKQEKQYNGILDEGEAKFGDTVVTTTGVLAEFTRLKQIAFGEWKTSGNKFVPVASPKLNLLIEMLEERGVTGDPRTDWKGDGGFKYIVASQFTQVIDFVVEQLESRGIDCLKITGAVTGKKRTQAQQEFQSKDGARVLALNTIAGGAALTLDAWCDEMFILDETWVRDEQIQLEGRINNRDVEKRVAVRTFHYIRTKDSIEEEIADSGMTQDEFQKALLDRRRGVELRQRILTKA